MTKLLLKELFDRQVQRRDRDVQQDDVSDALPDALPKFGPTSFQHFWDDAIRGDIEDREQISATRRRVLLAMCRCLQAGLSPMTQDDIVREATIYGISQPTTREVIQQFLDRAILALDENGGVTCRVPLFEIWLRRYGSEQIPLGSGDEDTIVRRHQEQLRLKPRTSEIEALVRGWGSYRGDRITVESVEAWLGQFGGPADQRAIMPILEHLTFNSQLTVRMRLREAHGAVGQCLASQGHTYKLTGRQQLRDDLLVCGLEESGSGATHLVKLYRHENSIYTANVVDRSQVPHRIRAAKGGIRAVLVLEDFIGTGTTATNALKEITQSWTDEDPWDQQVEVFLIAISGFEKGIEKVRRAAQRLDVPVRLIISETLDDSDRCFSDESRFFDTAQEREHAQALCTKYGTELEPRRPLGYGDSEAAVCFEHGCPNNSLPVLWKDGPGWTPLFLRH